MSPLDIEIILWHYCRVAQYPWHEGGTAQGWGRFDIDPKTRQVKLHRPEKAGPAVEAYRKIGALDGVSADPSINAYDWAGQVEWFNSPRAHPPPKSSPRSIQCRQFTSLMGSRSRGPATRRRPRHC